MKDKDKIIKSVLITTVAIIVFLPFIGNFLFAFFCLPWHSSCQIIIPDGRYISWEELNEKPLDIEEKTTEWFDSYLRSWQIDQLKRYMKTNNVYIVPDEYVFYASNFGDELIRSFEYIEATDIT